MTAKILQINFKFNVSKEDYEKAVSPLANDIAAVPGLRWKVWIMNAEEREAGGILLFEDASSLEAYTSGPIAEGILNHPALSDFNVKVFDVMEEQSKVTRGI